MLYCIYTWIFSTRSYWMDVSETLQGPTCWMLVCFLCLFERWDFQTCSFEVEHIGFGTSKQTLWPKPNRFGAGTTPLLGWSFDPLEDFLAAGTRGYRVIGPLWEEGCIIFQVASFSGSICGRARFGFPENEISKHHFFLGIEMWKSSGGGTGLECHGLPSFFWGGLKT